MNTSIHPSDKYQAVHYFEVCCDLEFVCLKLIAKNVERFPFQVIADLPNNLLQKLILLLDWRNLDKYEDVSVKRGLVSSVNEAWMNQTFLNKRAYHFLRCTTNQQRHKERFFSSLLSTALSSKPADLAFCSYALRRSKTLQIHRTSSFNWKEFDEFLQRESSLIETIQIGSIENEHFSECLRCLKNLLQNHHSHRNNVKEFIIQTMTSRSLSTENFHLFIQMIVESANKMQALALLNSASSTAHLNDENAASSSHDADNDDDCGDLLDEFLLVSSFSPWKRQRVDSTFLTKLSIGFINVSSQHIEEFRSLLQHIKTIRSLHLSIDHLSAWTQPLELNHLFTDILDLIYADELEELTIMTSQVASNLGQLDSLLRSFLPQVLFKNCSRRCCMKRLALVATGHFVLDPTTNDTYGVDNDWWSLELEGRPVNELYLSLDSPIWYSGYTISCLNQWLRMCGAHVEKLRLLENEDYVQAIQNDSPSTERLVETFFQLLHGCTQLRHISAARLINMNPRAFINCLQQNTLKKLTVLDLSRISLSIGLFEELFTILQFYEWIESLYLDSCQLGDSHLVVITRLLPKAKFINSLNDIDLNSNQLQYSGILAFLDMLDTFNVRLRSLFLSFNVFSREQQLALRRRLPSYARYFECNLSSPNWVNQEHQALM